VPVPLPEDVTVRVEGAPINPADLLVMFGPVDTTSLEAIGSTDRPVVRGVVPPHRLASVNNRLGQSMAIGNEGAGTIVAAGSGTTHLLIESRRPGESFWLSLKRIDPTKNPSVRPFGWDSTFDHLIRLEISIRHKAI
jgi:NADPH:quinone reductase-like Zn-dependent oxidoreductase